MRPLLRFLASVLLLGALIAPAARAACGEDLAIERALRLGLLIQVLMPSNVPNFTRNALAYGLAVGVPAGPGSIFAAGSYGTNDGGLSSYLIESNYRIWLRTPFLTPYVQAGAHFLHYRTAGTDYDGMGVNIGFGFVLSMERNFEVTLGLQGYLRAYSLLAFGGGFNWRL
jgi:hypothetical protein